MSENTTKRGPGCFIGAAAGIVLTLAALGISFVLMFALGASFSGASGLGPGPKIAHIDLEGLITSATTSDLLFGTTSKSMVDRIKEELETALDDDDVKAIVLRVNSPGGEVTASDTIYHAVKQASARKPVVVYMDSMAASGGYYAACGATEIMANETTLTGSIGVIISTLNYRELFGKVGLESRVFKSGEFKDILSGSREMSPEEAALVQEMVMESYGRFVGIVSEARGIPEAQLRQGLADGRVLSGAKAKEGGLVDATGYIEDAYDRARELGKAPEAEVWRVRSGYSFLDALLSSRALSPDTAQRVEIDVSERLWPRLQPGMIYLLPSAWVP